MPCSKVLDGPDTGTRREGAAEAVGLLPMLGQEWCEYLMLLVDQLSPIV